MDTYRIALRGLIGLSDQFNLVYTIQQSAGISGDPSVAAISSWIDSMFTEIFLTTLTNRMLITGFVVEKAVAGKWVFVTEADHQLTGGSSTDTMPNQIAAVVIGITASRRRGKKFIPCLSEGNVSNGVLAGDFRSLCLTWASFYAGGFSDGLNQWVSGVCKKDGTSFLPFINFRVNQIVGTQRRRKQGIGS